MSQFIEAHRNLEINLDNFFFAHNVHESAQFTFQQLLFLNAGMQETNIDIRYGPACGPGGQLDAQYNKGNFNIGIYLPDNYLERIEFEKHPHFMVSIADALKNLEKIVGT